MKVLLASSEIATLAQTGGLADVSRSLPIALNKLGIEIAVVMPKYRQVQEKCEEVCSIRIPVDEQLIQGRILRTQLPHTSIPVFLIDQEHYYDRDGGLYNENGRDYPDNLERFTFFCRAVLEIIARGIWVPSILHANDWQTALLPVYIKTLFKNHASIRKIKTLYTIHNLAYQGIFPAFLFPVMGVGWEHFNLNELEFYNQINLMKGGIVFADAINTVSPTYSKEIQTEELGCGLDGILKGRSGKLYGIRNAVDYEQWSPETDTYITQSYNAQTASKEKAVNKTALLKEFKLTAPKGRKPLFGVVSRLAHQKGIDLVASILPTLIRREAQIIILGSGEPKIEESLLALEKEFPESCGVRIAYDTRLSHWIEAGADLFLMPSRFEPCGLNQMYSLRYGTIPIVRATGGLADTVTDIDGSPEGNGFSFDDASPAALLEACDRAITQFENEPSWFKIIERAMLQDFTWTSSAKEYLRLYESLAK